MVVAPGRSDSDPDSHGLQNVKKRGRSRNETTNPKASRISNLC